MERIPSYQELINRINDFGRDYSTENFFFSETTQIEESGNLNSIEKAEHLNAEGSVMSDYQEFVSPWQVG